MEITSIERMCVGDGFQPFVREPMRAARDRFEQAEGAHPFKRFSRMLLKILSYVSWSSTAGRFISIRTVKPTLSAEEIDASVWVAA